MFGDRRHFEPKENCKIKFCVSLKFAVHLKKKVNQHYHYHHYHTWAYLKAILDPCVQIYHCFGQQLLTSFITFKLPKVILRGVG